MATRSWHLRLTASNNAFTATPPNFGRGPVNVTAQFRVNTLYDVDPVTSTFTIDVFLRLYWKDPRLVVSPTDFPSPYGSDYRVMGSVFLGNGVATYSRIWTPDLYFGNEVSPDVLNEVIKLTPYTGDLFWSRHFVIQLTNNYSLVGFPFDRQSLRLALLSYSYNENQMNLFWRDAAGGGPVFPPIDPQVFSTVTWDYVTYRSSKIPYSSRQGQLPYDMLLFDIDISRRAGSYYIKSFMPLGLLVALTAVSYWFSVDAVPERLGLAITLVLTIVSFYNSVTAGLPMVNYATQIDWYVFISFVVAFFSLLEVAVIHHLVVRRNNRIVATELDMFCRRFVLPFWILFNIGILVQLPADTPFNWLWLLVGILAAILLFVNLWLFAYYVWKRYDTRLFLEESVYGREHLELTGDDLKGRLDIGKPGSFKRKMHDMVISSTDAIFKTLHIHIPGAKVREDVANGTYVPDGNVAADEVNNHISERDRLDRVSMDEDIAKSREEADMLRIREAAQLSNSLKTPVVVVGANDVRKRRASVVKIDGIEIAVPFHASSGAVVPTRDIGLLSSGTGDSVTRGLSGSFRAASGNLGVERGVSGQITAIRATSGAISSPTTTNAASAPLPKTSTAPIVISLGTSKGTLGSQGTGTALSPTLTVTQYNLPAEPDHGDSTTMNIPMDGMTTSVPRARMGSLAGVPVTGAGMAAVPDESQGGLPILPVVPPDLDDGEEEQLE